MKKKKILVVGAGEAAKLIVNEMINHPKSVFQPVVIVDDDKSKHGKDILSVPIDGGIEDIPKKAFQYNVEEILIAIPSATGKQIRRIINVCEKIGINFKIIPGVLEIIKGDARYNQIRNIREEDLLGREIIEIKRNFPYIQNRVVLITGAGGSIGFELTKQVLLYNPKKVILLGHGENSIFMAMQKIQLLKKNKKLNLIPIIADITDDYKIRNVFDEFKPEIIFHSAAHKHVPLMEYFPEEAVKNNVYGTMVLAKNACRISSERFVLISSDKAVDPENIMGLTKRLAEIVVKYYNRKGKTIFSAVRFGNVLGSRGSVVPIFKMQIESGGPVKVTHPDAARFFMSVKEAAQLVLQAANLAKGGEIFLLDMGEEIKIEELAKNLIVLSGYKVGRDIKIEYTGLRPGEKLRERLFSDSEELSPTAEERILKISKKNKSEDETKLFRDIRKLVKFAKICDSKNMGILIDKLKSRV